MEIRANYVLVGLFSLLVLLGAVGFTLWIGSRDKGVAMTSYDISFTESVRGLSVNNDVLFSGIRVGKVTEIKISRVTPGEVRVRVSVNADTPVREDSRASLEIRGITGISVVAISGGTAESPLKDVAEEAVGTIQSEPSPLASVMNQVPDLISTATNLVRQMEKMFSDDNTRSVTDILASLSTISTTLASRADTVDRILVEAEKVANNFDVLITSANDALVTDVKSTTRAMNNIAKRVDSTLTMVEPGLKQFSTQGLSDMRMLMVEARNLVHVLTRVGQKLESDPRRFLFGEPVKEYQSR